MGRLLRSGTGRSGLGLVYCVFALHAAALAQTADIPSGEAYRGGLCFTTVVEDTGTALGSIVGSQLAGQEIFATGDDLFVNDTQGAMKPGDGLLAYRIGSEVKHPSTGKSMGSSVYLAAYLTVTETQGTRALAHVEFACAELERGDLLRPLHDADIAERGEGPPFEPARLITPEPADATMVFGSGETVRVGEGESGGSHPTDRVTYTVGDVLTLDAGNAAGWVPGTWGTVYVEPSLAQRYGESSLLTEPLIAAQGYVLWATPTTSAFMITEAVGGVEIGMRVRRLQ